MPFYDESNRSRYKSQVFSNRSQTRDFNLISRLSMGCHEKAYVMASKDKIYIQFLNILNTLSLT